VVLSKNDPLRRNFVNFVPKGFLATPVDVLRLNFVKFGRREIGKIVRCLYDKNNISPGSLALATAQIAPKICHGQPPRMYSERSRFNPNRFTFGGVISERVNTIKTGRKVFPAFGYSLASSRIMKQPILASFIGVHQHGQNLHSEKKS